MLYPPALSRLIEALRCLPGVGAKSAQRMAFHLLERERVGGRELAQSVSGAIDRLGHCQRCRMFAEGELCPICASVQRDRSLLCVVESPADIVAIEQSASYRGCYFVLMGHLSPLDGIGPNEIGIDAFESLLREGEIREVILATNPTVEGEATAHFLWNVVSQSGLGASRIAHGVPVGGELEYVDGGTLARSLTGRQRIG